MPRGSELTHSDGPASAGMQAARVARLANDIAVQFPHLSEDEAAEAIAAHIRTFWEPRMIAELAELAAPAASEPGSPGPTSASGSASSELVERAAAAARLVARQG